MVYHARQWNKQNAYFGTRKFLSITPSPSVKRTRICYISAQQHHLKISAELGINTALQWSYSDQPGNLSRVKINPLNSDIVSRETYHPNTQRSNSMKTLHLNNVAVNSQADKLSYVLQIQLLHNICMMNANGFRTYRNRFCNL